MITKIFSQDIMINNCPACGSIDLEIFRTLNSFPAILFPIEKEKWNTVSASPIQSSVCNECGHIFLNQIDKLFSDNIYKNYYYLYPYKGLESMRSALEALSRQKGRVLVFKPRDVTEGKKPSQKEKAVSGAVNS